MWAALLNAAIVEIMMSRAKIADLAVMQDSYSRLYKQIYGNN